MRKFAVSLFIIFLTFAMQGQNIAVTKINVISANADKFVGIDQFNDYYFIKDNTLIKLHNRQTVEYQNVALGKISKVDIQNPLFVVVFYESFNTVVLLDNQMNEVRKINFNNLILDNGNTQLVLQATGLASQNRLWIYDALTQQIGLFDYLNNDCKMIGTPIRENIIYYQTDFNTFRWIEGNHKHYVTDIFGKVKALGIIDETVPLQFISDSQVLYQREGKLNVTDWAKSTNYTISGVENSFKNFYYKDQILSIFTNEGITNYKITLP